MRRCDYFEGTSGFKNLKSVSRGAWSKLRSVLIGSDFIDKNEVYLDTLATGDDKYFIVVSCSILS